MCFYRISVANNAIFSIPLVFAAINSIEEILQFNQVYMMYKIMRRPPQNICLQMGPSYVVWSASTNFG